MPVICALAASNKSNLQVANYSFLQQQLGQMCKQLSSQSRTGFPSFLSLERGMIARWINMLSKIARDDPSKFQLHFSNIPFLPTSTDSTVSPQRANLFRVASTSSSHARVAAVLLKLGLDFHLCSPNFEIPDVFVRKFSTAELFVTHITEQSDAVQCEQLCDEERITLSQFVLGATPNSMDASLMAAVQNGKRNSIDTGLLAKLPIVPTLLGKHISVMDARIAPLSFTSLKQPHNPSRVLQTISRNIALAADFANVTLPNPFVSLTRNSLVEDSNETLLTLFVSPALSLLTQDERATCLFWIVASANRTDKIFWNALHEVAWIPTMASKIAKVNEVVLSKGWPKTLEWVHCAHPELVANINAFSLNQPDVVLVVLKSMSVAHYLGVNIITTFVNELCASSTTTSPVNLAPDVCQKLNSLLDHWDCYYETIGPDSSQFLSTTKPWIPAFNLNSCFRADQLCNLSNQKLCDVATGVSIRPSAMQVKNENLIAELGWTKLPIQLIESQVTNLAIRNQESTQSVEDMKIHCCALMTYLSKYASDQECKTISLLDWYYSAKHLKHVTSARLLRDCPQSSIELLPEFYWMETDHKSFNSASEYNSFADKMMVAVFDKAKAIHFLDLLDRLPQDQLTESQKSACESLLRCSILSEDEAIQHSSYLQCRTCSAFGTSKFDIQFNWPNVIKQTIDAYGGGDAVPRELFQNADDAEAEWCSFILDLRTHKCPNEQLISPAMLNSAGPALLFENSAQFSESDFKNIGKHASGSKQLRVNAYGHFGVGFTTVYGLTDVPILISSERLTVFDPTLKFIDNVSQANQYGLGLCEVKYPGMLKLFSATQKPMTRQYQNTCLRLALRTQASTIRSSPVNPNEVASLVTSVDGEVLLFLRSLQKFTTKIVSADGTVAYNVTHSKEVKSKVIHKGSPINHVFLAIKSYFSHPESSVSEFEDTQCVELKHSPSSSDLNPSFSIWRIHSVFTADNEYVDKFKNYAGHRFVPYAQIAMCHTRQGQELETHKNNICSGLPIFSKPEIPFVMNAPFVLQSSRKEMLFSDSVGIDRIQIEWNRYLMLGPVLKACQLLLLDLQVAGQNIASQQFEGHNFSTMQANIFAENAIPVELLGKKEEKDKMWVEFAESFCHMAAKMNLFPRWGHSEPTSLTGHPPDTRVIVLSPSDKQHQTLLKILARDHSLVFVKLSQRLVSNNAFLQLLGLENRVFSPSSVSEYLQARTSRDIPALGSIDDVDCIFRFLFEKEPALLLDCPLAIVDGRDHDLDATSKLKHYKFGRSELRVPTETQFQQLDTLFEDLGSFGFLHRKLASYFPSGNSKTDGKILTRLNLGRLSSREKIELLSQKQFSWVFSGPVQENASLWFNHSRFHALWELLFAKQDRSSSVDMNYLMKSPIANWAIIPVYRDAGMSDVKKILTLKCASRGSLRQFGTLEYFTSSEAQILDKLGIHVLAQNIDTYFSGVPGIINQEKLCESLFESFHNRIEAIRDLEPKECFELLAFFNRRCHINSKNATENHIVKQQVVKLPLFRLLFRNECATPSSDACFVSDWRQFVKLGQKKSNSDRFFLYHRDLKPLYEKLGFQMCTPNSVIKWLVTDEWLNLSGQDQTSVLVFLLQVLMSLLGHTHSALPTEFSTKKKIQLCGEDILFLESIKNAKFIPLRSGGFGAPCEIFSQNIAEIDDSLPAPASLLDKDWTPILLVLGIQVELPLQSFITQIAKIRSSQNIAQSTRLVHALDKFQIAWYKQDKDFMQSIQEVPFISGKTFNQSLHGAGLPVYSEPQSSRRKFEFEVHPEYSPSQKEFYSLSQLATFRVYQVTFSVRHLCPDKLFQIPTKAEGKVDEAASSNPVAEYLDRDDLNAVRTHMVNLQGRNTPPKARWVQVVLEWLQGKLNAPNCDSEIESFLQECPLVIATWALSKSTAGKHIQLFPFTDVVVLETQGRMMSKQGTESLANQSQINELQEMLTVFEVGTKANIPIGYVSSAELNELHYQNLLSARPQLVGSRVKMLMTQAVSDLVNRHTTTAINSSHVSPYLRAIMFIHKLELNKPADFAELLILPDSDGFLRPATELVFCSKSDTDKQIRERLDPNAIKLCHDKIDHQLAICAKVPQLREVVKEEFVYGGSDEVLSANNNADSEFLGSLEKCLRSLLFRRALTRMCPDSVRPVHFDFLSDIVVLSNEECQRRLVLVKNGQEVSRASVAVAAMLLETERPMKLFVPLGAESEAIADVTEILRSRFLSIAKSDSMLFNPDKHALSYLHLVIARIKDGIPVSPLLDRHPMANPLFMGYFLGKPLDEWESNNVASEPCTEIKANTFVAIDTELIALNSASSRFVYAQLMESLPSTNKTSKIEVMLQSNQTCLVPSSCIRVIPVPTANKNSNANSQSPRRTASGSLPQKLTSDDSTSTLSAPAESTQFKLLHCDSDSSLSRPMSEPPVHDQSKNDHANDNDMRVEGLQQIMAGISKQIQVLNCVDERLRCAQCRRVMDQPQCLPCGHSVCGSHIRKLKSCPNLKCKQQLEVPAKVYPNLALQLALDELRKSNGEDRRDLEIALKDLS